MVASLSRLGISMDHLEFGQSKEIYDPNNFPSTPTPHILHGQSVKQVASLLAVLSSLLCASCLIWH